MFVNFFEQECLMKRREEETKSIARDSWKQSDRRPKRAILSRFPFSFRRQQQSPVCCTSQPSC